MYEFNQFYGGQTNPYQNRMNTMPFNFSQRTEIVRVNGENGARAYNLPPNSSILLLDETAPIVWLAQTDGAGYKTITPYTISPHQAEPTHDYNSLAERVKRLEDMFNAKSNDANAEQTTSK